MLKIARYPNFSGWWGRIPSHSEVVYAIYLDCVVFSGITPPHARTSTINAAEIIISEICHQEGIDYRNFTFYDLQTSMGYSGSGHSKPGEFVFDRISFKVRGGKFFDLGWTQVRCPKEIIGLFAEYIGPDPIQMNEGYGTFDNMLQVTGQTETYIAHRKGVPWVN